MARTIPTEHQHVQSGHSTEIRPGGALQDGNATFANTATDLELINQQSNRNHAANTRSILAYGLTRKGIAETSASYSTRYQGHVFLPHDEDRIRLRVYGQNCTVRLTIDGQVYGTVTCTGTLQWYAGSNATLASLSVTNPSSGMSVLVEGSSASSGTHYCVMIEHVGPYTSTSDLDTMIGDGGSQNDTIDDTAFDPDYPWDVFLAQRLSNNARWTAYARSPGVCIMHPVDDPHRVSSCAWRADGPYTVAVPPWCDKIAVYVTGKDVNDGTVNENVDVSVMVEGEDWADVLGRSVELTGRATATQAFEGLPVPRRRATGWTFANVYLVIKCDTGAAITTGATVGGIYTSGQIRISTDLSTLIPGTWGRALRGKIFSEVNVNQTPKPSLSYGDGEVYKDLAGAEYNANDPIWYSPSDLMEGLPDTSTIGTLDIVELGIYEIYGVSAYAYPSTINNTQNIPLEGAPPSSGLVQETVRLINDMAKFGTPIASTRHHGNTWQFDLANVSGATNEDKVGRWCHVVGAAWQDVLIAPIPALPNPSSPSSDAITIGDFYAQAQYLAVNDATVEGTQKADMQWRLVLADGPFDAAHATLAPTLVETGDTEDDVTVVERALRKGAYGNTYTVWDIIQTIRRKVARDGSGNDYEHDYTAQVSWPQEVIDFSPWSNSPVCSVTVHATSGNYPLFLKLQAKVSTSNVAAVVVGAHAWYGPRV